MSQLRIRKVAVLGAGVMGAQIAAHLVNANVETILFDLPAKEGDKNGIVLKAIANLGKLSPRRWRPRTGPRPSCRPTTTSTWNGCKAAT
jgi:3-hydroxyacyl-CoA dehydrogenase